MCVVYLGSTRKLYEKKLNEAMAKGSSQPSPDKTYYREEGMVEHSFYISI